MSLDLTSVVGLTAPPFAVDLPEISGVSAIQSILSGLTPTLDIIAASGLSEIAASLTASLMPSSLFEGVFEGIGTTAIGSILDKLEGQTSLADFATAGLLNGITPILNSMREMHAVQLAPILDAVKGSYLDGIVSPSVAGLLTAGVSASRLNAIGNLPGLSGTAMDWARLAPLDFKTPSASPTPAKKSLPPSPEVEAYETLEAAESLSVVLLRTINESIVGVQVMLHAAARNLEKRDATADRSVRLDRKLYLLGFVVTSVLSIIAIARG